MAKRQHGAADLARAEHEDREAARRRLGKVRGAPIRKDRKRNLTSSDRRHISKRRG